jgi:hypothetical protein
VIVDPVALWAVVGPLPRNVVVHRRM